MLKIDWQLDAVTLLVEIGSCMNSRDAVLPEENDIGDDILIFFLAYMVQ